MGLLSTAAVIAVIAILIVGGAILVFYKTTSTKLTLQQAETLVLNDIKAQNPNANVSVITLSNSTLKNGSWQMVLSVVYNGSRPCPTVLIEQFDYPATGLHPTNDTQASGFNTNTGACSIYVYGTLPPYPPLSIASAYASNNTAIHDYVNRFGYNNITASACLIPSSDCNSTVFVNQTNNWLIRYRAPSARYSLYVMLDQSGQVLSSSNVSG